MRESPAHFLRRRLAAAPLLARVGADHIDDGNCVGGSGGRHGAQILERHMASVYFLIAQDAHQQFRRQIVAHGSQAHAHHDRSRGHDQWSLPPAADLLTLQAQLPPDGRLLENRGLPISAHQLGALPADGRDHRHHRTAHLDLLVDGDRARDQIDARQVQSGHQYQITVARERISFQKNPRAGDDLIRIGRQRPLIKALRHGQRLSITQ